MNADGEHMKADSDVFRALGWGVRRYAWLPVLFVVVLGALVPAILERVPDRYDAQAQVGPAGTLKLGNLDALPRLGESVFHNGAVAEDVRQSFDPPLARSVAVIPDRVELVAAQDNLVFAVIGHGSTPESAQRVANISASRFTQELNKYTNSVGPFTVQRLAQAPAQPVPKVQGALATGIGLVAGLVAGVGAVALLLVLRRPVTDSGSAEEAAGTRVIARVQLGRGNDDVRGLPQLCHRLLASRVDMLLLTGPPETRRLRRQLASSLASFLGRIRTVVSTGDGATTAWRPYQPSAVDRDGFVIINGPTPVETATRPDSSLSVLVVREGIGYSALRKQAESYLDGGTTGLVLVRRVHPSPLRWMRRLRRPSSRRTEVVAAPRPRPSYEQQPVDAPTD